MVTFFFTLKEICQLYDVGREKEPVTDNPQEGMLIIILNQGPIIDRGLGSVTISLCLKLCFNTYHVPSNSINLDRVYKGTGCKECT